MLNTTHTFHTIVGTNITARIVSGYAKTFMDLLQTNSKVERNHKRKVERLYNAAEDVLKVTEFLLDHKEIQRLADVEATSIETVLFLASDLEINKRQKVIDFIMELNAAEQLDEQAA